MSARVKVVYESETVDADELVFRAGPVPFGTYELEDGARIEFRHNVRKIYRLCDKKKPDGSPIYLVTGDAVLNVIKQATEAQNAT